MAYCTILSTNYLAKALTLAETLQRHHPGSRLTVLVIDSPDAAHLADIDQPGVDIVGTDVLGLPARQVLQLATIYDLVEFATAIKPPLLRKMLEGAEQAAYLDPDTYVTSPMVELSPALEATEGGILLTPHFLEPVPPEAELQETHLLTVGVYNLGFCAVDRRALPFLEWWWGHLVEECLWEPLSGLFVDQKWVDIGSVMFHAGAWQHRGYNVSVTNLHERPLVLDDAGFGFAGHTDRLRLFHFHAFDTSKPDELSTRLASSTVHLRTEGTAVDALCREYAESLLRHEQALGPRRAVPLRDRHPRPDHLASPPPRLPDPVGRPPRGRRPAALAVPPRGRGGLRLVAASRPQDRGQGAGRGRHEERPPRLPRRVRPAAQQVPPGRRRRARQGVSRRGDLEVAPGSGG